MSVPPNFLEEIDAVSTKLAPLARTGAGVADLLLRGRRFTEQHDPMIGRLAAETALGRVILEKEDPALAQGFFTTTGLEQRSRPPVAAYHASLLRGCNHVLEICTGLGFDTAALAREVERVTTIEVDPVTALFARHNLGLLKLSNVDVLTEDFSSLPGSVLSGIDGVFADPARRSKSAGRSRDHAEYQPQLKQVMALDHARMVIKVAPSADVSDVLLGWKRVFVGFEGECKEQLLVNDLSLHDRTVHLIEADVSWHPMQEPKRRGAQGVFPSQQAWTLLEPHAALSRAGALDEFFQDLGAARWDADVIYGAREEDPGPSPFIERFHIFFTGAFDEKILKRTLSELRWDARTEIKKRVFPEEPEVIRKRLKLPSYEKGKTEHGVVFLTKDAKRLVMALGNRLV